MAHWLVPKRFAASVVPPTVTVTLAMPASADSTVPPRSCHQDVAVGDADVDVEPPGAVSGRHRQRIVAALAAGHVPDGDVGAREPTSTPVLVRAGSQRREAQRASQLLSIVCRTSAYSCRQGVGTSMSTWPGTSTPWVTWIYAPCGH